MEFKFCRGCAEKGIEANRPISEFGKQASKPNGLRSRCKSCRKEECDKWNAKILTKERLFLGNGIGRTRIRWQF